MLDNNTTVSYEDLAVWVKDRINNRFDDLRARRTALENKWVEMVVSASSGTAPKSGNFNTAIASLFSGMSDPTLPSLARKLNSREMAWLDEDWFRWQPDGIDSTDEEGAYWLTDWQQDYISNELSDFHAVMRAALWQRQILNISAINYHWIAIPKMEYSYELQGGKASMSKAQSSNLEYEIQGVRYQFVNMFGLYPDVLEETVFDRTNHLDLYHTYYRSRLDVENDDLFDPSVPYAFDVNVLYRDNQGLSKLVDGVGATFSPAMTRLNKQLGSSSDSSHREMKRMLEIRTVYLRQIKLPNWKKPDSGEGRGWRLVYAVSGSECIPLLLEKNLFDFNKKSIRLSRQNADPFALYVDSSVGISINQHNNIVWQRQMQNTALAHSIMPNRLWSSTLQEIMTPDTLKSAFTGIGTNITTSFEQINQEVVAGRLDPTKPIIMNPAEEMWKNVQVIDNYVQSGRADIQQVNSQVNQETGAGATAAYNRQVAVELDLITKEARASLCRDWLKPSLEFGYEMAKSVFSDQKMVKNMNVNDQQKLMSMNGEAPGADYDDLVSQTKQDGMSFGVANSFGSTVYSPASGKKATILNRVLFKNLRCGLKVEFEDAEYSKPMELEQVLQIHGQMIQNCPDDALKVELIYNAMTRIWELTGDSKYAEYRERLEQLRDAAQNPPPPTPPDPIQQQAIALQGQKMSADIEKTQSESAKNMAEVENKKVDNAFKVGSALNSQPMLEAAQQ